jgi:hypothetical protein
VKIKPKIGKLYQFKKYFWMLYPSEEIAALEGSGPIGETCNTAMVAVKVRSANRRITMSYITPNSVLVVLNQQLLVVLNQQKRCYKVLTIEGRVGWICLHGPCEDDIEEINE